MSLALACKAVPEPLTTEEALHGLFHGAEFWSRQTHSHSAGAFQACPVCTAGLRVSG